MTHGGQRRGAGRPKGQGTYGTTTRAMRVPEHLVDDVRDYSKNDGYKIPLFSSKVQAGVPSVAEDHIDEMIDINKHLIHNPKTTFCVKVSGLSMINAGIHEGDVLVVDSSVLPREGKIIVVAVDNMLTVKRLSYIDKQPFLMPENPDFEPIAILQNSDVHVWGVVTNILRKV